MNNFAFMCTGYGGCEAWFTPWQLVIAILVFLYVLAFAALIFMHFIYKSQIKFEQKQPVDSTVKVALLNSKVKFTRQLAKYMFIAMGIMLGIILLMSL